MFDEVKVGCFVEFAIRLHGFDVGDYYRGVVAAVGREGDEKFFAIQYPAGRVKFYECDILGKIKIR